MPWPPPRRPTCKRAQRFGVAQPQLERVGLHPADANADDRSGQAPGGFGLQRLGVSAELDPARQRRRSGAALPDDGLASQDAARRVGDPTARPAFLRRAGQLAEAAVPQGIDLGDHHRARQTQVPAEGGCPLAQDARHRRRGR